MSEQQLLLRLYDISADTQLNNSSLRAFELNGVFVQE